MLPITSSARPAAVQRRAPQRCSASPQNSWDAARPARKMATVAWPCGTERPSARCMSGTAGRYRSIASMPVQVMVARGRTVRIAAEDKMDGSAEKERSSQDRGGR